METLKVLVVPMKENDNNGCTIMMHNIPLYWQTWIMLSYMINAREERDVATTDIPEGILQTDKNSGENHKSLYGIMTEII